MRDETTSKQAAKQEIDPMLVSALVCPKTRTALYHDTETNELVSKKAKLAFPIRQGVPIMLVEEARDIS